MKRYNGAVPWEGQDIIGADVEKAAPAREAGLVSDLLVPLGQAGVTSGFPVFHVAPVCGRNDDPAIFGRRREQDSVCLEAVIAKR